MLLKYELMLLKCYFKGNTNQNGVLFPTNCVERVLNSSYLVSINLNKLVSEFLHKTTLICKTHNFTLKIRNHHLCKNLLTFSK